MNNNKQTAVNWLVDQIKSDQNQKALSASEWMEVIEQAIAMEREQIVKAWEYGCMTNYGDAQTYYNETFKSEKSK